MALKNWWEKVQGDYPERQGGISPRCCYNGAKWIGGYLDMEGAYLRDALRFLRKYGTVTEAEWPYIPRVDANVPPLSRVKVEQMEPWRIASYVRLESIDELLEALASGVPVYIGTPWFTNWINIGRSGKLPPANGEIAGGHATLLLGYNLKEGRVIGQNSWGAYWGDRGFYYMLIDDLEKMAGDSDFWTVVDLEPPSPPAPPEPSPAAKICEYLAQAKKFIETLQMVLKCEEDEKGGKAVNLGFRDRWTLFLEQPLETNKAWIMFSVAAVALAVLIHLSAQTYFFTSSYFSGPNLYDVWPRIDQITHALSSLALTAAILNFNLPLSFRQKWIIALKLSVLLGGVWEIAEYATAPFWGWIHVATSDTLLDLFQDFLGASFAILLYGHMVRKSRREAWFPEINGEDLEWIKRLRR